MKAQRAVAGGSGESSDVYRDFMEPRGVERWRTEVDFAAVNLSRTIIGPPDRGQVQRLGGRRSKHLSLGRWCGSEQLKTKWQSGGTFAVGQEAEVADAHEAFGKQSAVGSGARIHRAERVIGRCSLL